MPGSGTEGAPQETVPTRQATKAEDGESGSVGTKLHPRPQPSVLGLGREPSLCPGPLGVHNIIPGPHKRINLNMSLLHVVKHLTNSPRMPWQGPDQRVSRAFDGPCFGE